MSFLKYHSSRVGRGGGYDKKTPRSRKKIWSELKFFEAQSSSLKKLYINFNKSQLWALRMMFLFQSSWKRLNPCRMNKSLTFWKLACRWDRPTGGQTAASNDNSPLGPGRVCAKNSRNRDPESCVFSDFISISLIRYWWTGSNILLNGWLLLIEVFNSCLCSARSYQLSCNFRHLDFLVACDSTVSRHRNWCDASNVCRKYLKFIYLNHRLRNDYRVFAPLTTKGHQFLLNW